MAEPSYPDEWCDPVTGVLMKNPMICKDGYTYDKTTIDLFISRGETKSPYTRQPINFYDAIPNRALKDMIDAALADIVAGKPVSFMKKPMSGSENPFNSDVHNVKYSTNFDGNTGYTVVSIEAPEYADRKPSVFIMVDDVSGSMGENAKQTAAGGENDGFSRLDLVKHSNKTCMAVMNENDYMALVSFHAEGKIEQPITKMNVTGKSIMESKIDALMPLGSTNVWDGLRLAFELANSDVCKDKNVVIMLLTDGVSHINPPKGVAKAAEEAYAMLGKNLTIHTYGYGYDLDSNLLAKLATMGNGMFSYIPDSSMIGTVFVNSLSYFLSCASNNYKYDIVPNPNVTITPMGHSSKNLGLIQYGQSRDLVFKVTLGAAYNPDEALMTFKLKTESTEKNYPIMKPAENKVEEVDFVKTHFGRALFIDTVMNAMNTINKDAIIGLLATLKSLPQTDFIKDLIREIESDDEDEGQTTKAFSKEEWYNKWGKHYLRSLTTAHKLQVCNNFKDPSVQKYGGRLFGEIQNHTNSVFITLPAPTPSNKNKSAASSSYSSYNYTNAYGVPAYGGAAAGGSAAAAPAPAAPVTMASYYNSGGGCFGPECDVKMADGTIKKMKDIKRGDIFKTPTSEASVISVVKIKTDALLEMVYMKGLVITPYHPVRIEGKWYFPIERESANLYDYDYIYNIVLDQDHIMIVNDIECVTLGHGFEEPTVQHDYFGKKIIDDLMKMPGWIEGNIIIKKLGHERDASGKVTKWIPEF